MSIFEKLNRRVREQRHRYRNPRISPEFDCVEMKTEIQDRLLRETSELGEKEAQKQARRTVGERPNPGCVLTLKSRR
jgi:hypothetical protein